jgi:hypothetical protein
MEFVTKASEYIFCGSRVIETTDSLRKTKYKIRVYI